MTDAGDADCPSQSDYLGVYEDGAIRLSANVDWPDGTRVFVRVADYPNTEPGKELGKVIIAGFGLAGRWIADIFDRHGIEYVVVEKNAETVATQRKLGRTVVEGDIGEEQTLRDAGIDDASILALTVPDGSITSSKAPFAVQHYVGTRLQQFPKVSTGTYGATLAGGGLVEYADLDISALGFSKTPVGIAQLVDGGTPALLARYTWDGSTATRARVMFFRPDGQNIVPGRCRYHLILWSD